MSETQSGQRHDRSALILYGSETGNAQDAAEQLGRHAERLRFSTRVAAMDSVGLLDLLTCDFVVFVISTTGQGDIPNNANKFWKSLLRKRLPPDCLSPCLFTTFGFGDSSYPKFNWAARKLHKRLEQLGGREVYPRGEGDEQHPEGSEAAFLPWSADLRKHLLQRFPLPEGTLPIPDDELLPPKWTIELADDLTSDVTNGAAVNGAGNVNADAMDGPIKKTALLSINDAELGNMVPIDLERPPEDLLPIDGGLVATVEENRRITAADHWQDVRNIKLWVPEDINYKPGDIVTIYPKNFPEDVESLISLMGWDTYADKRIVFRASDSASWVKDDNLIPTIANMHVDPKTVTLRSLLLHNLDITAIPRRFFFEIMARFTTDPMQRERLLEFCNPAYTDEFFDYTTRPRRSMLEVLQDFPSVKLPWQWAPYVFPVLRGRQFSISSGGELRYGDDSGTNIELTVALVKYRTVLKKIRQGVCSRYLDTLPVGTQINVMISDGTFGFTSEKAKRPVLMIAPGTGVAPMRSLLWERLHYKDSEVLKVPGMALLIFGGRNRDKDFLYRDEYHDLDVTVKCAWSRDQKEKVYVQDVVRQNAELVTSMLLMNEGTVFVCGSSGKMPLAVRQALVDAFVMARRMTNSGYGTKEAEGELAELEREKRYIQETW